MVVVLREKAYTVPKSINTDNLPPTQIEKTIKFLNDNLSSFLFKVNVTNQAFPDYIPTEAEYSAKNRTQIIRSQVGTQSSTTLYTVPANKILFITSAWGAVMDPMGESNPQTLDINPSGTTRILLQLYAFLYFDAGSGNLMKITKTVTASYPMPLKLEATRTVILNQTGNVLLSGGFTGWLEDV